MVITIHMVIGGGNFKGKFLHPQLDMHQWPKILLNGKSFSTIMQVEIWKQAPVVSLMVKVVSEGVLLQCPIHGLVELGAQQVSCNSREPPMPQAPWVLFCHQTVLWMVQMRTL